MAAAAVAASVPGVAATAPQKRPVLSQSTASLASSPDAAPQRSKSSGALGQGRRDLRG